MIIIGKTGICLNCGAEFNRKMNNQKYCSKTCGTEFSRKRRTRVLVCQVCGQSFVVSVGHRIYCSESCQLTGVSEKPKNSTKAILTATKCVICGKPLDRTNQKVCSSPECIKERRKQTNKYKYKPYQPKKPANFKLTPEMKARLREIQEINRFRQSMDLRPISAGIIKCRMCEQDFFSEDITRVKMCEPCKEAANEFESDNLGAGGSKQNKKWMI